MTLISLAFYPLQVDITAFWGTNRDIRTDLIVISVIIVLIIILFSILNHLSRRGSVSKGPLSGIFYWLISRRLLKKAGLSREQKKMLKFVFKTDNVTDIEKSLHNASLLDRHFRRAYRVILQTYFPNEAQNRLSLLFSTRNLLDYKIAGDISSTTELKDDTIVTVTTSKDKYDLPVISARGEHLALKAPINALGSTIKFSKGEKFNAVFFTRNNKGFSFETRNMGYSTTLGHTTLLLEHSNELTFLSQRRHRRRQTSIPCSMFIVHVEETGKGRKKKQRLIVDKRLLNGDIADISMGGCSIKAKVPLKVETRLKIEFANGKDNVAALGQILRTNRSGYVTVAHIKFLRVSRKSMNSINAFVYEYVND